MDTKIEIKQEDPLSDYIDSQNDSEFFTKDVATKTQSNVLLDNDCDKTVKMEIKSEPSLPDFRLEQIEIDEQTVVSDSGSHKESEFIQEDPAMNVNKYNSDDEMYNKVEIKPEYLWLKTETPSVYDEMKDDGFSAVKFPRLCIEAVTDDGGNSPLPSIEYLREDLCVYTGKDSPTHGHSTSSKAQGSCVTEKKDVVHDVTGLHKCEICDKRFTRLSSLRRHSLIHEGKKPHVCEICDKRFTEFTHLKNHKLIHEGKKPHKCATCEKRFTELSNLKKHILIHEGKKPHKCELCEKRFRRLSYLNDHKLIHDNKKPHKCEICEKSFTVFSSLKKHNLTHEGKRPHKCEVCEKRFTQVTHLRNHKLIHEKKKPHKCEICDKRFTELSNLKKHTLIHEGKTHPKC